MNKTELVKLLLDKPGYLKSGSNKIAQRFNVTKKTAFEAIKTAKSNITVDKSIIKSSPIKRLFFDIETSPNIAFTYRVGNKVYITPDMIIEERKIICISYKWEHESTIQTLTWNDQQDDKELLEIFSEILLESDEAIAHNGDRYDIPFIRTRCLIHNIPMLPDVKTLDTYKKSKRFMFNSNKLDYIGQLLVNEKKHDTGGFDLWKRIQLYKDKEALDKMVKYCEQDVLLLEKVFKKIENYIKLNTHAGVIYNNNNACCPGCTSINYKYIKKLSSLGGTENHYVQCTDCNKYYKVNKSSLKKLENGNI